MIHRGPMIRTLSHLPLPLLVLALSAAPVTVEMKGEVVEVSGLQVRIALDSELFPNVGDKVEIRSNVPGIGETPLKGTWEVTDVEEGFVMASADGENPRPQRGQTAIIFSDEPRTRARFEIDEALLGAAGTGDVAGVRRALDSGADVNVRGANAAAPLGSAASKGHGEVVQALIAAGADLEWEARGGQTAMNVAAAEGHAAIVRALIQAGAEVDTPIQSAHSPEHYRGATPLIVAADRGTVETVRTLLQAGADVNASSEFGATGLGLAALRGEAKIVRTLIEAGADVNAKARFGETPLLAAVVGGDRLTVGLLVEAGVDVNARTTADDAGQHGGMTPLMIAAGESGPGLVSQLLAAGADPRLTNDDGQTALTMATEAGHDEVISLLREPEQSRSLALEALGRELLEAAEDGDVEAVEDLLRTGAPLDARGEYGETPLMAAASEGHGELLQSLIVAGADVNAKATGNDEGEGAGWTALMVAALYGHEELVSGLLSAGADAGLTNGDRQTALNIAAAQGHEAVVRLLESAR